jgi:hypothetical protein
MYMDDGDQLRVVGLEKDVTDVVEEEIDSRVTTDGSLIAKTILVDFEFPRDTFVVGVWTGIDIGESLWPTIYILVESVCVYF